MGSRDWEFGFQDEEELEDEDAPYTLLPIEDEYRSFDSGLTDDGDTESDFSLLPVERSSQVADMPLDFTALGTTGKTYSGGFNDTLKQEYDTIGTELESARETALQPPKLSGGEAISRVALGALPALIGAAFRGSKGALAGADAAMDGVAISSKFDAQDIARRDANNRNNVNRLEQRRNTIINRLAQNEARNVAMKDKYDYLKAQTNASLGLRRKYKEEGLLGGQPTAPRTTSKERLLGEEAAREDAENQAKLNKAKLEKEGALSDAENKIVTGKVNAIKNTNGLFQLINGVSEVDYNKVGEQLPKALAKLKSSPSEFRGDGWVSDLLAQSGVDPNSTTGQFFLEAFNVGRENAVGQNGVATDQDVAQEVLKILPAKLEKNDVFLKRLNRYQQRTQNSLYDLLENRKTQGFRGAESLMNLYKDKGYFSPRKETVTIIDTRDKTKKTYPIDSPAVAKARGIPYFEVVE